MVDAVNAFVLTAGMSAQPLRLTNPARRRCASAWLMPMPIAIMPGLSLWPFSVPEMTMTSGLAVRNFFRVYRSPVFNVRRGDIVAACCVGNRAPHIFAEGVAVFGRAFVAELDIDFRFGLLGARDAFLDVGNASGVFGGNFLARACVPLSSPKISALRVCRATVSALKSTTTTGMPAALMRGRWVAMALYCQSARINTSGLSASVFSSETCRC